MFWSLAVALASPPIWTADTVEIRSSEEGLAVLRTPTGSVTVGSTTVERITPDGTAIVEPLGFSASGRFFGPSTPCDLDGDGYDELIDVGDASLGLDQGPRVLIRDRSSGTVLRTFLPPSWGPEQTIVDLACTDLEGDGEREVITVVGSELLGRSFAASLWVWNEDGTLRREVVLGAAPSLQTLALGQTDLDPALEVVLPDRTIVDGATWSPQGTIPTDVLEVQLFDVDGDGVDEQLQRTSNTVSLVGASGTWWSVDARGAMHIGDYDGDGDAEVVVANAMPSQNVYSGPWTVRQVRDALTGLRRVPASRGRRCRSWWPHDHDGDGVAQLRCDDAYQGQIVFDPALGTTRQARGQGGPNPLSPHRVDLDGDGVEEVLWMAGVPFTAEQRIVVRDAGGQWLGQMALPELALPPTVVDVDLDGDHEVVHGGRVWHWSRSGGFTEGAPLIASTPWNTCVLAVDDFDGDGLTEVLFDSCSTLSRLQRLDLGTGGIHDLGVFSIGRVWHVGDVDGDGRSEVIGFSGVGMLRVQRIDGSTMFEIPADHWAPVPHRRDVRVVVSDGADLSLVQLGPLGASTLFSTTAPASYGGYGLFLEGGYLWYRGASLVTDHAWSPSMGDVALDALSSTHPRVVVGNTLWLTTLEGAWGQRWP